MGQPNNRSGGTVRETDGGVKKTARRLKTKNQNIENFVLEKKRQTGQME